MARVCACTGITTTPCDAWRHKAVKKIGLCNNLTLYSVKRRVSINIWNPDPKGLADHNVMLIKPAYPLVSDCELMRLQHYDFVASTWPPIDVPIAGPIEFEASAGSANVRSHRAVGPSGVVETARPASSLGSAALKESDLIRTFK